MLAIRSLDYEAARQLTLTALSVDTYDGAANYYYGLANRRLGRLADARDGLQIAALTPEFRGAAWTELGRMALDGGQLSQAAQYAEKALGAESGNLDALGVAIVAARRRGDRDTHERLLARLEAVDPLSHQARLERLLATGDTALATTLARGIRSELPEQVLLELAAWYLDAGDAETARRVLEAAGEQPEALYWRACAGGCRGGAMRCSPEPTRLRPDWCFRSAPRSCPRSAGPWSRLRTGSRATTWRWRTGPRDARPRPRTAHRHR